MRKFLIFSLLLVIGMSRLQAETDHRYRGGIDFTLQNPQVLEILGEDWFSIDVYARAISNPERLGSGIVLLNYNPEAFGSGLVANQNVNVTKGALLETNFFPMYSLYSADHAVGRMALTYEYVSIAGYGNLLSAEYQLLMNIKLKIQNMVGSSGTGFEAALMQNNQFKDDNFSLIAPVNTGAAINHPFSFTPQNLRIVAQDGQLVLNWDELTGCTYKVYQADDPQAGVWLPVATNLSDNQWLLPSVSERAFFRVTAYNRAGN